MNYPAEDLNISKYPQVVDIIDDVFNGKILAMFEPMEETDIGNIMAIVNKFDGIKSFVLNDGEDKRVVLKRSRVNRYIPVSKMLKKANCLFRERKYEGAIELFEAVLPYFDEPRSFIYAKLGMAYCKVRKDDCSKAIDYLTLATVKSKEEMSTYYDFSEEIADLRARSAYNGVKVYPTDDNCVVKTGNQYVNKK